MFKFLCAHIGLPVCSAYLHFFLASGVSHITYMYMLYSCCFGLVIVNLPILPIMYQFLKCWEACLYIAWCAKQSFCNLPFLHFDCFCHVV